MSANAKNRKKKANILSTLLTIIIGLCVGIVGSVAFMAIIPTLALPAAIILFVIISITGGLTEGLVYKSYLEKFCRYLIGWRFFSSIDNSIIKRELKNEYQLILDDQTLIEIIKKEYERTHEVEENWEAISKERKANFIKNYVLLHPEEDSLKKYSDLSLIKIATQLKKTQNEDWDLCDKEKLIRKEALTTYRKEILAKHQKEVWIKKLLVVIAAPIAILAGIGFGAVAFSQVIHLLLYFGVAGGLAMSICPWTMAIPAAILYSLVMFAMIHRAIKDNIFSQIYHEIKDLFNLRKWNELENNKQKFQFVCSTIFKVVGFTLILSVATLATIFTAGTWLHKSVIFFHATLGVIQKASDIIGWAIAGVMMGTNTAFTTENSIESVKSFGQILHNLAHISWKKVKSILFSPLKILGAIFNGFCFVTHVACNGAVAAMGGPSIVNMDANSTVATVTATATGTAAEVLCDFHAIAESMDDLAEDEDHDHHHDHDHSHDVAGTLGHLIADTGKWMWGFFSSNKDNEISSSSVGEKEGNKPETKGKEKEKEKDIKSENFNEKSKENNEKSSSYGEKDVRDTFRAFSSNSRDMDKSDSKNPAPGPITKKQCILF